MNARILLLCHDLTTLLRLDSTWRGAGATDFAARSFVDQRVARRLKLTG
ncbi:MAG: hypothetical protein Q7J42_05145 [Sulfuritalea sp.]|nr:hypothetical protein [Sulfuritalea sp.]